MKKINLENLQNVFSALPANPRILTSGNYSVPWTLLNVLDKSIPKYKLHILNAPKGNSNNGNIPDRVGVVHETTFVGEGMRNSQRLDYIPCRLSLTHLLLDIHKPVDAVLVHTSKNYGGKVSLGIEVNILPCVMEAVRKRGGLVVGLANPNMPYTFGDGEFELSFFDYIVEMEFPLHSFFSPELSEEACAIGEIISENVEEGATLQLGIGAIPNAFCSMLSHSNPSKKGKYKIWTEMFSDGVYLLEQWGSLDPDTPIFSSFAFGSQELYTWMNRNPRILMLRTKKINDPATIAIQAKMTSINAALQVDLFDQANASRIGNKIYSGFGGSTDFIVGALHSTTATSTTTTSNKGQAFIALPSWHPKANVSTIVPRLEEPTTHFQHSAIVTEKGLAWMFGKSQSEQSKGLIQNCAHPKAKDFLAEEGKKLGLF